MVDSNSDSSQSSVGKKVIKEIIMGPKEQRGDLRKGQLVFGHRVTCRGQE